MSTPSPLIPLVEHYQAYAKAKDALPLHGTLAPYGWAKLPESYDDLGWWAYAQLLGEFGQELANVINELIVNIRRLEAWDSVIASLDDDNKLNVLLEFVKPLATLSLNLPYVIRSRFIFATAHLCHQANHQLDGAAWKDDLPADHEIYFEQADQYGAKWKKYGKLKLGIEKIGGKKYQAATADFRNKYNHSFAPQVVYGLSGIMVRDVDAKNKKVSYGIGGMAALTLSTIEPLLKAEADACRKAFAAFQVLVEEQAKTIPPATLTKGEGGAS